jgi:hypothetical protein
LSDHETVFVQINTVKYDTDWEMTNTYEKLQIVWSQFFTDMLLFIYVRSTSNIYWFIGIQICCKWIPRIAIWLLSTIRNIQSVIRWAIMKVILNYSCLPSCSGSIIDLRYSWGDKSRKRHGTVFTTTHFFRNSWVGPLSWCCIVLDCKGSSGLNTYGIVFETTHFI